MDGTLSSFQDLCIDEMAIKNKGHKRTLHNRVPPMPFESFKSFEDFK